jgi:hypothetical protein
MLLTSLTHRWQDIVGDIQSDTPPGDADKPACLLVEPALVEACAVLAEYSWSISIPEYPMGFTRHSSCLNTHAWYAKLRKQRGEKKSAGYSCSKSIRIRIHQG